MNKKQRKSSRSKNGIYRMMKMMSVHKLAKKMGVKIIKDPNLLYVKDNEEIEEIEEIEEVVEVIDEKLDNKANNETDKNNPDERKIIKPNIERKAFKQQYQVDISERNTDETNSNKKFENYIKWRNAEIADKKRRENLLCVMKKVTVEER